MPGPKAAEIKLSEREKDFLERLSRGRTSPQQEVQRAKIILKASEGQSNTKIAIDLKLNRLTVMMWRKRWYEASERVRAVEQDADNHEVLRVIVEVLSDAYRSGAPPTFSSEEVVQIIALACERAELSGLGISHWTSQALAAEATKRGIVASISPQSVARFLKGSRVKASSITLLAD
jgi:putative transposase